MYDHIFVFTNTLGANHWATISGRQALYYHSTLPNACFGPMHDCYAIPTLDYEGKKLPLYRVMPFVHEFILYALGNPNETFFVPVFEDHTPGEIAPLFKEAPKNILLPPEYEELL